MEGLAFIEELDPNTMDVVKVHDLSRKSTVMHSESLNGVEHSDSGVLGLVILPTRELALQVGLSKDVCLQEYQKGLESGWYFCVYWC